MDLKVILQDVRKFETEALVVGCYEDVRPLKGLAGELDWLLCGSLSQLLMTNRISGSLGDAALLTPRGKLPVQKLFMIGLGPGKAGSTDSVRAFARNAAESVLASGAGRMALEYVPSSASGEEPHVQAIKAGLAEGGRGRRLDVTLLVHDAAMYEKISRLAKT